MNERSPDPYRVLHLGRAATAREVAHAYRALVRAHHPDTRPAGPVSADPNAEAQELQEIMDAYAVLGDPVKRATYDRQKPTRPQPPPRNQGPFGPDLIIGPLQWEASNAPAPGRRLLWWIQF
jgi:DnaJ-class molecular chaperone